MTEQYPIRCHQCGSVTGNKWDLFWKLTGVSFDENLKMVCDESKRKYSDHQAIDKMGIMRQCCRNTFLSSTQYD